MSERNGYEDGVPCWVDIWQDDVEAAAAFYTGLFGWEAHVGDEYTMFRNRGLDVAGAGAPARGGAAWTTYVWVDDADAVAERAAEAGGSLVAERSTASTAAAWPSSRIPRARSSASGSSASTEARGWSTSPAPGR
jgi:uncharacterized protein